MPRFFFDFRQGEDLCPDPDGMEFADTEEAYLEAVEGAQEMWGELLRTRRDPRHCLFEVRDANRELLFVFPFQEVLDNCRDRKVMAKDMGVLRATANAAATANRVKQANQDFQREMRRIRKALDESRALLAVKG